MRTKIIATIGPTTCAPDNLRRLSAAGMNIARLNGSHNTLDWHDNAIRQIRDTLPDTPILFDIPGRKIRTASLTHEPRFKIDDIVVLTTEEGHDGRDKVPVTSDQLHRRVAVGDKILADDGMLQFEITKIEGRDIHCRARSNGQLRSRKGINVPDAKMSAPLISEQDRKFIAFVVDHELDYVGISFVDSPHDVETVRQLVGRSFPRIVSKIENRKGLSNVDEIAKVSDVIMIDRGDLSAETNLAQVALFQKHIINVARTHGIPVIVATEMLHSMIDNAFPTKAEVSDITNAIVDGGAATMLSGETAVGAFPIESVEMMRVVATAAEEYVQRHLDASSHPTDGEIPDIIGKAIAQICRSLPVTKLVAITRSGFAARMIAAHQPRQPILAVSDDPAAARSFNLLPGTEGIHVSIPFSRTSTDHIPLCIRELWQSERLQDDDLILISSVGYPKSGNRMNLLETHIVSDLIETFGWSHAAPVQSSPRPEGDPDPGNAEPSIRVAQK